MMETKIIKIDFINLSKTDKVELIDNISEVRKTLSNKGFPTYIRKKGKNKPVKMTFCIPAK